MLERPHGRSRAASVFRLISGSSGYTTGLAPRASASRSRSCSLGGRCTRWLHDAQHGPPADVLERKVHPVGGSIHRHLARVGAQEPQLRDGTVARHAEHGDGPVLRSRVEPANPVSKASTSMPAGSGRAMVWRRSCKSTSANSRAAPRHAAHAVRIAAATHRPWPVTSCTATPEFAENTEIIQMPTSLGVDYALGYGWRSLSGC
jgi:hypothetical protein